MWTCDCVMYQYNLLVNWFGIKMKRNRWFYLFLFFFSWTSSRVIIRFLCWTCSFRGWLSTGFGIESGKCYVIVEACVCILFVKFFFFFFYWRWNFISSKALHPLGKFKKIDMFVKISSSWLSTATLYFHMTALNICL